MGSGYKKDLASVLERMEVDPAESDYVCIDDTSTSSDHSAENMHREPEALSNETMISWQDSMLEDPKNRLALSALNTADPRKVLASPSASPLDLHVFNVRLPLEGFPITDQANSGRCWIFASTNIFRIALMRRHGLDAFELSQSYLFFWNKLEKANWFLEQIIETSCERLDSRIVQTLLKDIIPDGGQWDMVHNLVEKYGLVPKALYPDSWSARNSEVMNRIIRNKLREAALTLRRIARDISTTEQDLTEAKEKIMREVLLVLTLTLGKPPSPNEEFTWEFVGGDGAAHERTSTPKAFARNLYSPSPHITSASIASMVSLVHDPRHEPYTPLTVSRLGNVVGGRGITYINVPMETLKAVSVEMLRAGLPIFFGSDVRKFSNQKSGIMDLDLVDYEVGFNTSLLRLDKADRLRTGESAMTHAMVLTGVHVDKKTGASVRWRVQNSYGKDVGEAGWFVMTDRWMDEFVYQVVVDPRYLSKKVKDVLDKEPTVLPLWDPMGALA